MQHLDQVLTFLLVMLGGGPVHAYSSPAIRQFDDFTLRYQVATLATLPPRTAWRYGVENVDPNRGIFVLRVEHSANGGNAVTVPAKVSVAASDAADRMAPLPMRAVRAGDEVVYVGKFDIRQRRYVRFRVTATPDGVERPLEVRFRKRLGSR